MLTDSSIIEWVSFRKGQELYDQFIYLDTLTEACKSSKIRVQI